MKAKGWQKHPEANRKFGQSYELFSGTYLSLATDTTHSTFQPEIDSIPQDAFQVEQIRSEDADGLLGSRGAKKYNGELKTLIKFTQAKGNSYQLHVKEQDGKWLPKPESWYFFEKGLATLGIQDKKKLGAYKKACKEIEAYMISLSQKVQSENLTIKEARELAKTFCKKAHIDQYVHTVVIPKQSIVDLHYGGIHHSWEEDTKTIPQGNILYEVQVDVPDQVSTLRSYDKGKLQDDGTIRELQIDDYFKHVDTAKEMNEPEALIQQAKKIVLDKSLAVTPIFNTPYYKTDEVTFQHELAPEYTSTRQETFHHIFALSGTIHYHDNSIDLTIREGHSAFVPARVGQYVLKTTGKSATVLKTYL